MIKKCTKCKEVKSLSEFYNYNNRGGNTRRSSRCKTCLRATGRSHTVKYCDIKANSNMVRRYGITLDDYNKMRKDQNYSCAICGRHEDKVKGKVGVRPLHIDHCHTTGKVRGLLCGRCNTSLERFELYSKEMEEYIQ